MGNVRQPLDEQTLRETYDDLVTQVQHQREVLGIPVPDTKTAEDFVKPILDKVIREHAIEQDKDALRPVPPSKTRCREPGEWYGEPEHSPRISEIPGTTGSFMSQDLGDVHFNAKTGVATMPAGVPVRARLAPAAEAARERFQLLMTFPEWRARCVTAATANVPRHEREKMLRKILSDSVRAFGNPLKAKEPKIIVH